MLSKKAASRTARHTALQNPTFPATLLELGSFGRMAAPLWSRKPSDPCLLSVNGVMTDPKARYLIRGVRSAPAPT